MLLRTAIVTCLVTLSASLAFGQTYYDTSYTIRNVGTMNYRVYLPENYDPNGPKLPVVLYLHSAAERGDSVTDIFQDYNNWVTPLIAETQTGNHQAILVMPESGSWQVWAAVNSGDNWGVGDYTNATQGTITPQLRLANSIVDQVVSARNGDANRLYVTGPSMGGFGTWDLISRYSTKYAAAAPLSGGGNLDAAKTTLANMPVWMYHGVKDSLIPATNDDAMFIAMLQAGGNPIYSRIATAGHDGWDTFYQGDTYSTSYPSNPNNLGSIDFYDWMFSQSLDQRKPVTKPSARQPFVIGFSSTDSGSNRQIGNSAEGNSAMVYNVLSSRGVSNLSNKLGYSSNIGISVISGKMRYLENTGAIGSKIRSLFTEETLRQSIYCFGSDPLVLSITGLDDSIRYNMDIFGSTDSTFAGETRYELIGANNRAGTLNVFGNVNDLLTLTYLQSINGTLTFRITVESGTVGVLNAFQLTPIDVPEPGCIGLLSIGGLFLIRRRHTA